jgi:putative endopeptidase
MIKQILLASAATLSLAAAAPAFGAATAAQNTAAKSTKPMLGTWGVDLRGMDKSVKPGENFFNYANGTWDKTVQIPSDRPSWGSFDELGELSRTRTRTIIEESAKTKGAPGSNQQKVGDMYASFMDEAAIERAGTAPLRPWLAKVNSIRTKSDLARYIGEANQVGIGNPFDIDVDQDLADNTRYTAYIGQGGLGLPDRDYYLDDTNAKYVEARGKYKQHIVNMLRLAGISTPEARAERIYDLEKKIAEAHWTKVEQRQVEKLNNPVMKGELATKMPGLDWAAYTKGAGIADQQRLVAFHPSALAGAAKLVQSEPLDTWKDYMTFRTIASAATLLPKAFVEENFAFNGKTLQGIPQLRERWKRGVDLVGSGLGEAVGQLYVERYFPPESKAKMDVLVANLIKAMDVRLANLEWMTPETKAKARTKLAAFTPKIGYPSKWRDYSALEIRPGDSLGNAMRARQFEYNRNLKKLGAPVDRDEWGMSPQTVNAYANPLLNEIVFPAAILQAPFFDPNADDAVNYGGIGAVIGHEITHHFDDQGSKFDPKGNLSEWWTKEDVERFKQQTSKVVAQYGAYEPLPGTKLNGELTLGENMADLAGLTIAYDAYRMSLNGKEAPVIDGYTGDQRFFLGFGQVWRSKYRDDYLRTIVATDPHSPDFYRANVVRNFDPWYKAFDVKDGAIYLPPEQRIKIW